MVRSADIDRRRYIGDLFWSADMTPRRVDLLGTQLPASRHVTCLHLPQWRLFGKEGILFLLFRSTRWYIAAFTVLQMCHLLYKTLKNNPCLHNITAGLLQLPLPWSPPVPHSTQQDCWLGQESGSTSHLFLHPFTGSQYNKGSISRPLIWVFSIYPAPDSSKKVIGPLQ